METIKRDIVQKTVDCLAEEGMKYVGKTLIQSFNYCMMGNFACFFAFFLASADFFQNRSFSKKEGIKFVGKASITQFHSCMLGNFACLFLSSDFFQESGTKLAQNFREK